MLEISHWGIDRPALGSGQLERGHLVQSVLPGPFVLLDKVSGRHVNTSMPALSPSSPVLVMEPRVSCMLGQHSLNSAHMFRKGGGN